MAEASQVASKVSEAVKEAAHTVQGAMSVVSVYVEGLPLHTPSCIILCTVHAPPANVIYVHGTTSLCEPPLQLGTYRLA